MTTNNYKQKATGHVTSLANGHFTGSEARFVCKIPTASSNKKNIILLTLDWLLGRPEALLQLRNVSSVRVVFANGTKRTPTQKWGNLLWVLYVPYRQCLAGISNAFSASFTSIWPAFPRFYCTRNKACLLCATPAGTCRVQSPGFPKIVYYEKVRLHQKYNLKIKGEWAELASKANCLHDREHGNTSWLSDWILELRKILGIPKISANRGW